MPATEVGVKVEATNNVPVTINPQDKAAAERNKTLRLIIMKALSMPIIIPFMHARKRSKVNQVQENRAESRFGRIKDTEKRSTFRTFLS